MEGDRARARGGSAMGWVAQGPGRQASGSPRECSIGRGRGRERTLEREWRKTG